MRLLVGTVACFAVLSVLGHLWHEREVRRNAAAFRSRAKTLESENSWEAASDYLSRYLRLCPEDYAARIHLARVYDHNIRTIEQKSRAAVLYSAAIALLDEHRSVALAPDENQLDLLARHAELLLEIGNYSTAIAQADKLLAKEEYSPKGLRIRALALAARAQSDKTTDSSDSFKALKKAQDANPGDRDLALQLATIYRSKSDSATSLADADDVMNDYVAANVDRPIGYLTRYEYRQKYKLAGADHDLDRALELDATKDDTEIRLAAAQRALDTGKLPLARQYFEEAIDSSPKDRRGYLGKGQTYNLEGNAQQALECWREGLAKVSARDIWLNMRVAEALIQIKQLDEAKRVLDQLEPQLWTATATALPRIRLEVQGNLNALRAEWAIASKDYIAAVSYLHRVLESLPAAHVSSQDDSRRAQILLRVGGSYAAMQYWDQAAVALQQAAELQEKNAAIRVSAADAWMAAGRLELAISNYDDALRNSDVPVAARVSYAQALFQQQIASPVERRNWQAFQRALQNAQSGQTDSLQLRVLAANFAAIQGETDRALEMLRPRETNDKDAALAQTWEVYVLACEQWGQPIEADRGLEELRKTAGVSVRWVLLKTALLFARKQFDDADDLLSKSLPQVTEEERFSLEYRRAILHLSTGKVARARSELASLANLQPRNIALVQLLADLALDARDLGELERWEAQLQRLEGQDGTAWRFYRAHRSSIEAKDVRDPLFAEAKRMQADIQRLRPTWGPGYRLKGFLAEKQSHDKEATVSERQNLISEAIDAYERATQLGEQRVQIFEELIRLLYAQNRIGDASQYLDRLRHLVGSSSQLSALSVAVDLRQGDLKRALQVARDAVARNPQNSAARLWLGQSLSLDGQTAEAEKEFKEATRLAPDELSTWSALLSYYVRAGRSDEARETLIQLSQKAIIEDSQRPFILAQGYELLGDRQTADPYYREALRVDQESVAVWFRAANFFSPVDLKESERCLRHVLVIDPRSGAARRSLAALLAMQSADQNRREIWDLLDGGADGKPESASLRLKARLLMNYGGAENRNEARKILESLVRNDPKGASGDRLLLAQLLELIGNLAGANEQYLALVSRDKPDPAHLAVFVDYLLRNQRPKEATDLLGELAAIEPEADNFRTLELRARWLTLLGRIAEIDPLVKTFVDKKLANVQDNAEKMRLLQGLAAVYSSSGLNESAEKLLRQAVEQSPLGYRRLATWLASQRRVSEAIDLCLKAAEEDKTSQAAVTLASVLSLSGIHDADRQRGDFVLDNALQHHAQDKSLLLAVATLRLMQDRHDDAIKLFRRTLEIAPRDLMALNNLAILLSERSADRTEALTTIDKAIAIGGHNPQLLDTKGWILIQQQAFAEAESVLREAVTVPPADPRHWFHLALAHWRQGKKEKALQSLNRAREDRLSNDLLSPAELSQLSQLEKDLL